MKTTWLYAILFIGAAVSCHQADAEELGGESAGLVSGWCRPLGSAIEKPDGTFFMPRGELISYCWGAFSAIQKVISYVDENGLHLLHACAPAGGGRLQLVRVFIAYTNKHPERDHEDFTQIALDALQEAFPCGK